MARQKKRGPCVTLSKDFWSIEIGALEILAFLGPI